MAEGNVTESEGCKREPVSQRKGMRMKQASNLVTNGETGSVKRPARGRRKKVAEDEDLDPIENCDLLTFSSIKKSGCRSRRGNVEAGAEIASSGVSKETTVKKKQSRSRTAVKKAEIPKTPSHNTARVATTGLEDEDEGLQKDPIKPGKIIE